MVTRGEIQTLLEGQQYIGLIKSHREAFNSSLKEAKDAIDKAFELMPGDESPDWCLEHHGRVMDLFFPDRAIEQTTRILKAIDVLAGNWKELGFASFKEAVSVILNNY